MTRLGSRSWVIVLLAVSALSGLAASAEAATGLALLALATVPALFAVPPRGRPVLGVAVAGIGLAAALLGDLGDSVAAWSSAIALVAAGVLIALRGARWSGLARRYGDATASVGGGEPVDLWRAMDRGEDPTVGEAPAADAPEADGGGRASGATDDG